MSLAGHTFFWGHTKAKSGTRKHYVFSQWWKCTFHELGVTYSTAEQYMMAKKAELFGDAAMAQRILACHDPKTVKQMGRRVANFDCGVWSRECYGIVVQGNKLKFSQDPELRDVLLSTGDTLLVEASPYDSIWGIGLNEAAARAMPESDWPGTNLLGKALVDVRQWLRDGGTDAAVAAAAVEAAAGAAAAPAVAAVPLSRVCSTSAVAVAAEVPPPSGGGGGAAAAVAAKVPPSASHDVEAVATSVDSADTADASAAPASCASVQNKAREKVAKPSKRRKQASA